MDLLNQAANLIRDADILTSNLRCKKNKRNHTAALESPYNKNKTYH